MKQNVDNSALAMAAVRRGARNGVAAGNLLIETDAKLLAPVLTGHHRRSIASEVIETADKITGIVGHQSDYGGYLENGTRHMAAQPHFRPAFDKNAAAVQRGIMQAIGKELAASLPKAGA